ncbi:hypothetical protein SDC9_140096 [bioreactor metagenome]|uniref:Uncharacterized protein n=1 Tax=bioreactor metagenome TaxID=1076179 RepID=A0A645DTZ4_9ZZZZ
MHKIQHAKLRINRKEQHGNDREILRNIVGDAECGQGSPRHQQLFSDAHDVDELRRAGVKVDHIARFLGCLRAGVHGNRNVRLRKRGCVVRSVARHGDEVSACLIVPDEFQLRLRRCFGKKIINACFGGDGGCGHGVVARDHDGFNPHLAQVFKTILDAFFYDIF